MEKFWTWSKVDAIEGLGDHISGLEPYTYFEKDLWFDLGKRMWRKQRSNFQDHVKYIHNDTVNPFRVGIIQYTDHVRDMHYLSKYLPPTSMKGNDYDEADWAVCDK